MRPSQRRLGKFEMYSNYFSQINALFGAKHTIRILKC